MFTLLLACAVQNPRGAPAVDPRDISPRFEASAALVVSEWAAGEQLVAPLAIDVDWRGRLWVLEGGDAPSLKVLQDGAGAGFCDAASVFHTFSDVAPASGLAVIGRQALVASSNAWLGVADVDGVDGPREVSRLELPWKCAAGCGSACVSGPGGQVWLLAANDASEVTLARRNGSVATGVAKLSERASGIAVDSFGGVFVSERAAAGSAGRVLQLSQGGAVLGSAPGGDPRGLASYESNFIAELENSILVADRAGRLVALTATHDGGGVSFQERVVLAPRAASEPESFAPVDVAVGLDGAVFVLDEGGGRGARILRISTAGRRIAVPRLSLTVINGQLSSLLSPAVNVQATAFELLAAQGDAVTTQVQGVARARNQRWQARALWVLAHSGEASRAYVREQLSHDDARVRTTALRALASAGHDALDLARRFRGDPSSALRAEALELIAPLDWEAKRECVASLIAPWPAGEAPFVDALARAVGPHVDELAVALEAQGDKGLSSEARAAVLDALRRRRDAR